MFACGQIVCLCFTTEHLLLAAEARIKAAAEAAAKAFAGNAKTVFYDNTGTAALTHKQWYSNVLHCPF